MLSKKLGLALALSTAACLPAPARNYLDMYTRLVDPTRQNVIEVLRDGNTIFIDDVSRNYVVVPNAPAQVGVNYRCVLAVEDVADPQTVQRHANELAGVVAAARANGYSVSQLGSACWCLNLMANVNRTLVRGQVIRRQWNIDICR